MNCSRCRSLFDPAHDGSLDRGSALRAEFDEHLSSCPDCSDGWRQWQQAMTALQSAAVGRASPEETAAVLAAVERAAQRPAPGAGQLEHEAASRHGLLLAAAQQDLGRRRRVSALVVAGVSGALAASVAFMLCWPRAHAPAPRIPEPASPPVAAAPAPSPRTHSEQPRIVIDTRPLADVLRALGERMHQQLLARREAGVQPTIPSAAPPAAAPLPASAVADFVPLPGEALVSRADGQLSLTLVAPLPEDVPDYRALVPPLLQLLSTPDEEVVRLAEARLESVRSQVERLTGPPPADAPQKDSPRDSSGWRRLLGLPPAEAPAAPAGTRWRSWWEAVEPLLPDLGGAT